MALLLSGRVQRIILQTVPGYVLLLRLPWASNLLDLRHYSEGFVKQAFSSFCAAVVLALAAGAFSTSQAQTPSATPEPFLVQLSSSSSGFRTTVNDITANGRLVVFESNGDLATDRSATRNNADGNREIFIADYAQRRIFQLTNTKNVLKPPPSPTPTPTPTPTPSPAPTPTPTPAPVPADPALIKVEISNNRPVISLEPALIGGQRVYTIVFSSNAPDPANFDGTDSPALSADANQEIWIYRLPAIPDVDLTSGVDVMPVQPLTGGVFTPITNTPASLPPTQGEPPSFPGGFPKLPQVADDNRDATISDDGNRIAFVSTRNLVPSEGNTDANPELFFYNLETSSFTQGTRTQSTVTQPGNRPYSVFQQNPSFSSNGTVVVFLSSALDPDVDDAIPAGNDDGGGRGNVEIFSGTYDGTGFAITRQVTRTTDENRSVNLLNPGRRLSRDGTLIALESLAADPKANSTTNEATHGLFVYNMATDTFVQVGPRSPGGNDIIRFPTFTDYNASLHPATLIFASFQNFNPDGTLVPAANEATTGLNPGILTTRPAQVFATQADATSTNTFTRLTNHPRILQVDFLAGLRPLASNSRQRITFTHSGADLFTGNADKSIEAFYLLSPPVSVEPPSAPLSFFTGATEIPLPTPDPVPSPSPTPTPTPTPSPGAVTGLAAGEVGIIRTTVDFVASTASASGGSDRRSPTLPVELNGVSVSVNGAAAGLYFVGSTSRQINFVVPLGAPPGVATVVVNSRFNGGTQLRGLVQIVAAQPDIFTIGTRASLCNITNAMITGCVGEPFSVMSLDQNGTSVPTVLRLNLTGVRGVLPAEVKITIGTTDVPAADILRVQPSTDMPGFDEIHFRLSAALVGTDVPVVVTVTRGSAVFSSRPVATAPLTTITP
jgi:uncharacterized protein (TIGR03437 family)